MASVLRAAVGRAASLLSNAVSGASRASLSALKQTSQPNTCHASSRLLSTCLMHQRIVLSSSAIRPCNLSMIPPSNLTLGSTSVLSNQLAPAAVSFTQTRSYHVRLALRRRCASCYFTRRKGRLYVECKAKPRHKQMQMMSKHKLWREDYSKGNVRRAVWWKYNEEKRYYKLGDNQWSRYDWLKGKIGVTV